MVLKPYCWEGAESVCAAATEPGKATDHGVWGLGEPVISDGVLRKDL